MRISDWSADVCSSDLELGKTEPHAPAPPRHRATAGIDLETIRDRFAVDENEVPARANPVAWHRGDALHQRHVGREIVAFGGERSIWFCQPRNHNVTLADAAGATDAVEAHWCAGAGVPDQQRAWRNRDGGRDTAPEQRDADARRGETPPLRSEGLGKDPPSRCHPAPP